MPLAAPTVTATALNSGEIQLTWTAVSGAASYEVQQDSVAITSLLSPNRQATGIIVQNLEANTSYVFRVRANDSAGAAGDWGTDTESTDAIEAPIAGETALSFEDDAQLARYAAKFSTRKMVFYGDGGTSSADLKAWVDDAHAIDIPGIDGVNLSSVDFLLTSTSTLYVVYRSSGTTELGVNKFSLAGTPPVATLAASATISASRLFVGRIHEARNGNIVVTYSLPFTTTPSHTRLGVSYFDSSLNLLDTLVLEDTGNAGAIGQKMESGIHPSDGALWVFGAIDASSTKSITAFRVLLNTSSLTLDRTINKFLSGQTSTINPDGTLTPSGGDGAFAPNGELPHLRCVPDPTDNTLVLSYASGTAWILYTNSPFTRGEPYGWVKGAKMAVCRISGSGGRTFLPLTTQYCERSRDYYMGVDAAGEVWMAFCPVDTANRAYRSVVKIYRNDANVWTEVAAAGTTVTWVNPIQGFSDATAIYFNRPDNLVHEYTLSAATAPDPTPPPDPDPLPDPPPLTPLPPTGLSGTSPGKSKKVNLSWAQSTSPGITTNRIYRNGALVKEVPATESFSDRPGNGTFSYHVTAVSDGLESDPSNQAQVTVR